MWPECGPKAARMRPEFKILRPEISPCKFPVARAQPGLKLQARNPTRTMKKGARPSPSFEAFVIVIKISSFGFENSTLNLTNNIRKSNLVLVEELKTSKPSGSLYAYF